VLRSVPTQFPDDCTVAARIREIAAEDGPFDCLEVETSNCLQHSGCLLTSGKELSGFVIPTFTVRSSC